MAFNDIERARNLASLKDFLQQRRPPEHIRDQVDLGYAIVGQTVDIYEIRPDWQDKTSTRHTPVARLRFVRTQDEWRIYWMRQDLKWHLYEPGSPQPSLAAALSVVATDSHCCFFG